VVAVSVAIQCTAAAFRKNSSRATLQLEPIGMTSPQADRRTTSGHSVGVSRAIQGP
jgi:hypothetical protein